jgi:hypothetical protein
VRRALVLLFLTACGGGGDLSVSVLPPCPTCGPGHVRAAASTDVAAGFAAQPTGVLAFGGQHLLWLGADLSVTASAGTGIPGDYVSAPKIVQAVSGADGHAFAFVKGHLSDGGDNLFLVGLDPSGATLWTQEIVQDYPPPPMWLAIAPDGDAVVAADTTSGYPAVVGGIEYRGWLSITKLAAASGAVQQTRMFSGSRTDLQAFGMAPDGGAVIEGTLSGDINLAGAVGDLATTAPGRTVFVARLDAQFNGKWARQYVSTGGTPSADAVVADGQHVYVSGSYANSVDLGDGVTMTTTSPDSNYVMAYDDAGTYQWSAGTSDDIGVATLAPTPAGVLVGASYVDALTIGGLQVPAIVDGEGAIFAELVAGHAAWVLATTGGGDHVGSVVGSTGGRSYVQIEAADNAAAGASTTIDSVSTSGQMKLLLEVGTATP